MKYNGFQADLCKSVFPLANIIKKKIGREKAAGS